MIDLLWSILSDYRVQILLLFVAILVFITLPYGPLKGIRFVRVFCCKMGWHSHGDWDYLEFDGASQHARCKWCGYEGMLDSGGSLF